MDYTVLGILQARILEWVAVPFSRGSSQPRDWTQVSHIAGGFFTQLNHQGSDSKVDSKGSQAYVYMYPFSPNFLPTQAAS